MPAPAIAHTVLDIGWAAAELLIGLFDPEKKRSRLLCGSEEGPSLSMLVNDKNQIEFRNTTANFAKITVSQSGISLFPSRDSQSGERFDDPNEGSLALRTKTYEVPANGGVVPFDQYPDFTKGILTAFMMPQGLPATKSLSSIPYARVHSLTAKNFGPSKSVPIEEYASFDINGSGIVFYNGSGASLTAEFTVSTDAPYQGFQSILIENVNSNGARFAPLPQNVTGQIFADLSLNVYKAEKLQEVFS
jgi:hypothetical protein